MPACAQVLVSPSKQLRQQLFPSCGPPTPPALAVIRRMPRRIFVPLPDATNRERILQVCAC